ncbi:MAG: ABC transporter permease [Bradyrhizobiaceae bacterium]|nr:MAG: ABC transporter permease [Bradyrhizobiaceae bacterium]
MSQDAKRARLRYLSIALISPVLIFILWIVSTRYGWVKSVILPSPSAVWESWLTMLHDGYGGKTLAEHLGASGFRVGTAFIAGSALGIIVGLLRANSAAVDAVFLSPTEVLRPIPPLGIIPLLILWFGLGELSKIILIFLPVFLITMINTQAGVRATNPELIRASRCFGASSFRTFTSVLLPSALPQIFTGLRVALGTALSVLVAAELLGADKGIGFIILDASNFFKTGSVIVGIAIVGIIGLVLDRLFHVAIVRVAHWEGKN